MNRGRTDLRILPRDHIYTGVVERYFEREDEKTGEMRCFGFLSCAELKGKDARNIYFGLRGQHQIDFRRGMPSFTLQGQNGLRVPMVNEPVVFTLSETTRGVRAQPWAYLDVYNRELESVHSFRVVSNLTKVVLWEGRILAQKRPKELLDIVKYYSGIQVSWQCYCNGNWVKSANPIKSVDQLVFA